MEMLIVVLLLFLSERNAELKETLRSVLDFYRENRELIALLVSETNSLPAPAPAPAPAPQEEKSSPASGGDNLKILEAFLKNRKA